MRHRMRGLKHTWVPTEPAFRKFLNWLDEGRDSKGERYLEMRRRLLRYFERKNCLASDELADETLNRVARRLEEEGAITNTSPAQYCYVVAKYVFLEHLRQPQVQSMPESESHASDSVTSHGGESEKRLDCLEECLGKLSLPDRDLILEYYHGQQREKIDSRRELATRLGLTTNALSIRACRIRERLETCSRKCMGEAE